MQSRYYPGIFQGGQSETETKTKNRRIFVVLCKLKLKTSKIQVYFYNDTRNTDLNHSFIYIFIITLMTTLRAVETRVSIPVQTRDFSPFQNVETCYGANQVSYSVATRFISWGKAAGGMKLTTDHQRVSWIWMSGAVPLLTLYNLRMWTETTLLFCLFHHTLLYQIY